MNQKGLLTAWSDDKGFGFITAEADGDRVFAHISVYAGRGRPVAGRKVKYTITRDPQGRLRAGRFEYLGFASRVGASIAPEAMSFRQQLGFDLSKSLYSKPRLFSKGVTKAVS